MNKIDEAELRAIWKGQRVPTPDFTPEELQLRAAQFDREIRVRNLRDEGSFWLVAIVICVGGVLIPGLWVKVGSAMLVAWSLYSIWGLRRFGAVERPAAAGFEECAIYYQRQLERQRDIVLSWPLGIGLALPGFVLMTLGLGARNQTTEYSVALIAVFAFMYVALIIHGRTQAARWQSEIEAMRNLREG